MLLAPCMQIPASNGTMSFSFDCCFSHVSSMCDYEIVILYGHYNLQDTIACKEC